jgi:hypothetical protein
VIDLRLPGYEAKKTMTVLAGDEPCWTCGSVRNVPARYMCKACRWHYGRKKYHAYYCFLLRMEHMEKGTEWFKRYGHRNHCKHCIRNYAKTGPLTFITGE